jgi:bifunctional UDP-N-acetylglucosamine pyrophosphorylase / glucosamine-1-phosphate N-acetyltransferase
MRPNRLAFLLLTGKETGVRPPAVSLNQNLLGKSILQLTVGAIGSLRPLEILAFGAPGGEQSTDFIASSGARWLGGGEEADLLSAVTSAADRLARHPAMDLFVLDARLAFLSPGTLRSMLLVHRREKNSLTVAEGTPGTVLFVVKARDIIEWGEKLRRAQKKWRGMEGLLQAMAVTGRKTGFHRIRRPEDCLAVNTPEAMAQAVAFLRQRTIGRLGSRGVVVLDPATTWVDLDVRIGRGTILYPSVVIEGQTRIGAHCRIYPFVHLVDVRLGDRVKVLSSTVLERSRVDDDAQVGPFTHCRPNTVVRPKAKVGNFVEMKNTIFGERSKAGHLSYLGDAVVGEGVNIGAGTITCNYDGIRKSRTVIEEGAFIGSGSELVAPVRIGRRAYVGAGSVITKDVSPEALAVARGRQVERPGWVRRKKMK